jgi:serine/threonine protein kinase/Tol biopolymer transport system component
MPLAAGQKLGPYEITAPLGSGGMGEVYRAKDTRLGREVAIKILSAEFSSNQNRMERFEQEARAASALNHPNIITVHDVGAHNGTSFIAMEFIDGRSLREMLQAGALPIKRAVNLAAQIADGLAKAHEAGIVHRDLKPENIMISKDGFAKILDFGLAKSMMPAMAEGSVLSTLAKTGEGTILGTVGYMSPEQASGKTVDFRSDQFSFGSILYEMLSGKRAFARDTNVQSLSAIIQDDPEPLQSLSPQTPAPLRWIIDRCLSKDSADRYASTRDLARELQSIRDHFSDLTSSSEAVSQQTLAVHRSHVARSWLKFLPWALFIASVLLFAGWLARERNTPVRTATRRFEISIPGGYQLAPNAPLAMAPNGSAIVFGLLDRQMQTKLWLRYLDKFDVQELAGTDGASFPFWSPDSKSIAFFVEANSTLRRLDLSTGISQILCNTRGSARGGTWSADGTILFTPDTNNAIRKVSAKGGTPQDITRLDPNIIDGSHRFPVFLPDGQHFLFTLWSNHLETASKIGGIYIGSLGNNEIRKLSSDSSQAILAGNNRLLIYRNEALQSVSFDPNKMEITSALEEITPHPLFLPASGALGASASIAGDIAYALSSGEGTAQLAWVEANSGNQKIIREERLGIQNLVIAPDGNRFAAQIVGRAGAEIWVADTHRAVMTRLTRGGLDATGPVWSPDGRMIAFSSQASGIVSMYMQPADGSKQPELFYSQPDRDFRVCSWSPDGRSVFLESNLKARVDVGDIWVLDVATKKAHSVLSDPTATLRSPVLSPDGRWLSYVSDESGRNQLYVRPYPALDRKWQISQNGTLTQSNFFALASTTYLAHWRPDGRELLFISLNGSIDTVTIETEGANFVTTEAKTLFKPSFPLIAIAASPDHTKFLAAIVPGDVTSEPIRVVLNPASK